MNTTAQQPKLRKTFRDRAIGERFHTGKYYGAGARSHVLNCEVLEKLSNTSARVVEVIGDCNSLGHGRHFQWMASTFDI